MVVFKKKMQQKCDIGGQNSNSEYTNETFGSKLFAKAGGKGHC